MNAVWGWITDGIAHLLGGLKGLAASIVGKILATFGLSIITLEGILPQLKTYLTQFVSGMPGEIMQLIGALGIGQAMSMILSALTVRMAWKVFIVPTSVANALGST